MVGYAETLEPGAGMASSKRVTMNPMPPTPQPPPSPPQYEVRLGVAMLLAALLLFVWLAGRIESCSGRWTAFLNNMGLCGADAEGETRLVLLGVVLIGLVWIMRIVRRGQ